jgi:3-deoxy-manno-octulosonate cytidylyltransferase (CMP-KDO synthetase)
MKVLGVIPARFASSRFPGKPLIVINGLPMVVRVYNQVMKSKVDEVIVATDSSLIVKTLEEYNIPYMLTSEDHISGTDRCFEVASKTQNFDILINIQGDEPYILPEQINLLIDTFANKNVQIATLAKKIETIDALENPNTVKVVKAKNGKAMYFSRQALPYNRGLEITEWLEYYTYFKHIGIYGFSKEIIPKIQKLPVSDLEETESLEQLRWLDNGFDIYVSETEFETQSVDNPEDLNHFNNKYLD